MQVTFTTIVSGIVQFDFNGTTGRRITEVVQVANAKSVSSAETTTVRATAFLADEGTLLKLRLRKIMGMDNTFGRVGNILTGTRHGG
jgi:hypothetical protein